jgi:hypothetical protein
MSRKFKSLLSLTTLATDPSGSVGDVFFNTTDKALKIHNGTTWVIIGQNTDPTPFYMHTHTYDGDVHTIDISNQISFENISGNGIEETIPVIIGVDGGSSLSNQDPTPTHQELTLFDGGNVSDN